MVTVRLLLVFLLLVCVGCKPAGDGIRLLGEYELARSAGMIAESFNVTGNSHAHLYPRMRKYSESLNIQVKLT